MSVEYIRKGASASTAIFRYQLPSIVYFPHNNTLPLSLQLPLIATNVQGGSTGGYAVTPFVSCVITFDSATRKPTLNIHVVNTASAITKVSTLPFYRVLNGKVEAADVDRININILKFD